MTEAVAGDMIVADLDDESGLQWLPRIFLPVIPAAWAAGNGPCETGRGDQFFELFGQRWAVIRGDAGRKSDMMQQALCVVETEEKRADDL